MTLEHLDTVIAFAVVMLGASLLITIFNQTVSALLAYREANLAMGVRTLLETLHPGLAGKSDAIVTEVLTHPIISDSAFFKFKGAWATRWKLATAIRFDELLAMLQAIAAKGQKTPEEQMLADLLRKYDPGTTQKIQELVSTLKILAPGQTERAGQIVRQIAVTAQTSVSTMESWFNAAMDRVGQRFAMQMRVWTIVFSVVLAFAAHLDAFRLFSQLSNNAELRYKLVASADAVEKKAQEISANKPETDASQEVKKAASEVGSIKDIFEQAQLQLVPSPYPGWNFGRQEVWGILAAAGLLSLGAPFWFNALKNLSNLRSVVANKQANEQQGKQG